VAPPPLGSAEPVYAPDAVITPQSAYGQPTVAFGYTDYQPLSDPPKVVRVPLAIGATVCAMFAAIGSVMPWGTLHLGAAGSVTIDGLDRDGALTIVLSLIIVGVLIVSIAAGTVWPVIVGGGLFLVLVIISLIDINDVRTLGGYTSNDLGFDISDSISVGSGLWLLLASSVVGLGLCVFAFATRDVDEAD